MATTKKPAKKLTANRAPAKAASKTKVTRKVAPKNSDMKSFHRSPAPTPFFTFQLTKQTLYWGILCGIVLALGVWVMSLNVQVQKIYDQIDATNQVINDIP